MPTTRFDGRDDTSAWRAELAKPRSPYLEKLSGQALVDRLRLGNITLGQFVQEAVYRMETEETVCSAPGSTQRAQDDV